MDRRVFAAALVLLGCSRSVQLVQEDAGAVPDSGLAFIDTGVIEWGEPDAGRVEVPACGSITPVYRGPLCGSGATACALLRAETFPDGSHFRNDSPAIAVTPDGVPVVMFSIAEGGYEGYLATRSTDGVWSAQRTPFAYATGSAVLAPDGTVIVSTEDGAYGHELWTHGPSGWASLDTIPTTQAVFAGGLARSDDGCIHTAHWPATAREGSAAMLHLVRGPSGAWASETFGTGSTPSLRGAFAAPESGVVQLAWGESGGAEPALAWARAGSASWEQPFPAGTGASYAFELGAVTSAAGDSAYLLASFPAGLRVAIRQGGAWTSRMLRAAENDFGCSGPPTSGATCVEHRTEHHPIAVVASGGGDVRLIWTRFAITEERVATNCEATGPPMPGPPPLPACTWSTTSIETVGALEIADPSSDAISTAASDVLAWSGTAVIDAAGRIHVATYERDDSVTGSTVRYYLLGDQ
jgi:hypothetical protein